jgi:hypothetical protein
MSLPSDVPTDVRPERRVRSSDFREASPPEVAGRMSEISWVEPPEKIVDRAPPTKVLDLPSGLGEVLRLNGPFRISPAPFFAGAVSDLTSPELREVEGLAYGEKAVAGDPLAADFSCGEEGEAGESVRYPVAFVTGRGVLLTLAEPSPE